MGKYVSLYFDPLTLSQVKTAEITKKNLKCQTSILYVIIKWYEKN